MDDGTLVVRSLPRSPRSPRSPPPRRRRFASSSPSALTTPAPLTVALRFFVRARVVFVVAFVVVVPARGKISETFLFLFFFVVFLVVVSLVVVVVAPRVILPVVVRARDSTDDDPHVFRVVFLVVVSLLFRCDGSMCMYKE